MSEQMIGKEKNKLKIIYLLDIMKKTDEHHPVNSTQLIEMLSKYGIDAERKAIGRDIRALQDAGYEIVTAENRNDGWYMIDQTFDDHELKMLVDAVSAAKFLTLKDTRELIKKLKGLATKDGEKLIEASFLVDESLKNRDSSFGLKFDTVMRALADRKQIKFKYLEEAPGNKKKPRKNGHIYKVSPYYLGVWDYEYFIVANTEGYNNTSHYRIEMMTNIEVTEEPVRPMSEVDELKDIGKRGRTLGHYIKESVHLWSGPTRSVRISTSVQLKNEIMKKFGRDLIFIDKPNDMVAVNVTVAEGEGFYQWIAQYGVNMKIESPDECIEEYKKFMKDALEQYL